MNLGVNPKQSIDEKIEAYNTAHPYENISHNWLPQYYIERYDKEIFVIGMYHDAAHWDWITGKNDRGSLIYNVRLDSSRLGSLPKTKIRAMKPKFAILYEEGHAAENKYHVFRIHDYAEMTAERMKMALYPREPQGDYFIFRFDEEVRLSHNLDIAKIVEAESQTLGYVAGAPIYKTGKELMDFAK